MKDLNNLLLFELDTEAMEAVRAGNAKVDTGGIRRLDGTLMNQAVPLFISGADIMDLLEERSPIASMDDQLRALGERIGLTEQGIKQLKEIGWLNNSAVQRTYAMTYEGFKQTLLGLDWVTTQIDSLYQYIRQRDEKDKIEKALRYTNFLKTDAGNLESNRFDVTNSLISTHLDEISAFIERLYDELQHDSDNQSLSIQVLLSILQPYDYLIRKYSLSYYHENGFLPRSCETWYRPLSLVDKGNFLKRKIAYYINLECEISFRDKVRLSNWKADETATLLQNAEFVHQRFLSNRADAILAIPSIAEEKYKMPDLVLNDGTTVGFIEQ